ncbi:MAG TPA: magnesium/cobalt transporter CorA [Thermotogota bacterium]|nr:magnesium/cobalt transporter CorA [Thermotogota bacterium]
MKKGLKIKKISKVKSTIPGDIVVTQEMPYPLIQVIDYQSDEINVLKSVKLIEGLSDIPTGFTRWIDIQGLGDKKVLEEIKKEFQIHPLIMEDVVNIPQRVKVDSFSDYLFLVLKMFHRQNSDHFYEEQVSIILGKNYVISFQEKYGDCLDSLRDRLLHSKGIIRKMNADYLCYAIADTIFDHYFSYLEYLSENIEILEEKVTVATEEAELRKIYELKHALISLKRELWPTRECLNQFTKEEMPFISEKVKFYFRDCYDHILQTLEITESLKELTTELLNIYLSVQGNKLNEIMKVLTIISTIFIPLSFLVGLYGMNFEYMPELSLKFGYFFLIGVMIIITLSMFLWFRKKGWIGKKKSKRD